MSPAIEAAVSEWKAYLESSASRREELLREINSAWEDVRSLLRLAESSLEVRQSRQLAPADDDPLTAAIRQWERRRPMQRALTALDHYEADLTALARSLPIDVPSKGEAFLDAAGQKAGASLPDALRALLSSVSPLPLRAIVEDHEILQAARRGPIDGDFQSLLASCGLALRELARHRRAAALPGAGAPPAGELLQEWKDRIRAWEDRAAGVLLRYRRWANAAAPALRAAIRVSAPLSEARRARLRERRQRSLAAWARAQRDTAGLLELELHIDAFWAEVAAISGQSVESVAAEQEMAREVLRSAAAYLESWDPGSGLFDPPNGDARISAPEQRLEEWAARATAAASAHLPETAEAPRQVFPRFGRSWLPLAPRRAFLDALSHAGAPVMEAAFSEAAAGNLALLRQVERAREVIEYGLETARDDPAAGAPILEEAVANTRRMLADALAAPPAALQPLRQSCLDAQSAMCQELDAALDISLLGLGALAARRRGMRIVSRARHRGRLGLRTAGAGTARQLAAAWERFLVFIGWKLPLRAAEEPVVVRPDLDRIFRLQFGQRDLPLIYKRLFRLAPVEEPRYLVGREVEMQGIEQAFSQWNAGGFAAVLIAGARGSGKTSLLNCAVKSVFAGHPVLFSRFPSRTTDPAALHAFLRSLLDLPHDAPLDSSLSGARRIVILEELERAFLRSVNGLEAIENLLALIQQTASRIFWIFSINDHAFRFLDAATDLGAAFSHRINVTSMTPENLRKAILQRHNLSGLRLEFAPPPPGDPRVERLRRLLGLEGDGEALFFRELYRQSGGVFRTASELWQANVDRVEAGAVQMRFPVRPQHAPLIQALGQPDHFTLHAILQHGSLSSGELSAVLLEPPMRSAARLDRLRSLGLIEPDPGYPGFRVRPEARMVVIEALGSVNLI
jgi:hypothetical protein